MVGIDEVEVAEEEEMDEVVKVEAMAEEVARTAPEDVAITTLPELGTQVPPTPRTRLLEIKVNSKLSHHLLHVITR